jgi:hypothetical protein
MAAATQRVPASVTKWGDSKVWRDLYATAGTLYPSCMMCINSSGYAVKGADTAGYMFDGLLSDSNAITILAADSSGDKRALVDRPFRFTMKIASAVITDINKAVYILYDNEVAYSGTSNSIMVGWVDEVISSTLISIRPVYAGLRGDASFDGATLTYTGSTGGNTIVVPDNLADALSIKEGSNTYLTVTTTNTSEKIALFGPAATTTTAAGGAVNATGGTGGTTSGAGGAVVLTGGAGGTAGTGNGGAAQLVGGASGTGATGAGGALALTGGAAASTNGAGGAIVGAGGAGVGTGAGGAAGFTGGAGGATGAGGAVTLTGGLGGATSGAGGAVTLTAGAGQATTAGAIASLVGGASGAGATGNGGVSKIVGGAAASTNGSGGAAQVTGGVATGTGTGGAVTIAAGASGGAGGTAGSVTINSGSAAGGTAGVVTVQSSVALPAGGSLTASILCTSTASFGIYFGSGAPSVAAAKGSIYLRSDGSSTSTRAYSASDSAGTWVAITTAS